MSNLEMDQTLEKFVQTTLNLLEREREAEIEETRLLQENVPLKELERKGVCLLKLRLTSQHTGLYGRSVLVFEPFWSDKAMVSHSFTPGDIAGLSPSSSEPSADVIASGIVSRVTASSVSVAFEEQHDVLSLDDQVQYKLLKFANNVTYRRLKKALNDLNSSSSRLSDVLFTPSSLGPPLSFVRDGVQSELIFINTGLDESQREAVEFALKQRELAIIHGPPGTGKTTTVVEIIQQAIKRNLKVLACAPSNIAVDNLVERLAAKKSRVVRLGHPARLLDSIQRYALDALISTSDEAKLVKDVRKDMDKTLAKLKKTRDKGERQQLRQEMKSLRREYCEREKAAVTNILEHADVVMATLTGASVDGPLKHLKQGHFDIVVIDECSQSLEAACWIALPHASKCILAGDHLQLPPTILSHQAARDGLETTLMERLLELHGKEAMRMLTVQYRMHAAIMQWASDELYEGKLTAHSSVASHLLCDLPNVERNETTSSALLLIDTAGCSLQELSVSEEVSKGNEGEADLVALHVKNLVQSGLSPNEIAVIAPYNLQVDLLRIRLSSEYPQLEIKSVDGFQGREKEAVVISLVRSNSKGEVGFLAEDRRINVAVTRARRHVAVICDSETVSHHPFLQSMVKYLTDNGDVRSAQQFIDEGNLMSCSERPEYIDQQLKRSSEKKTVRLKSKKANKKKQEDVIDVNLNLQFPKDVKEHQKMSEVSVKEELSVKIIEFLNSSQSELEFSSSLNSFQRRCVHEIAENMGLNHSSQGEGNERYILVSKKKEKKEVDVKKSHVAKNPQPMPTRRKEKSDAGINKPLRVSKEQEEKHVEEKENVESENSELNEMLTEMHPDMKHCEKCGKDVPSANYDLHNLRCIKVEPKKPASKKKKKPKAKAEDTEDFDALIEGAMQENRTCHFPKCKNNAATLGQNCEFCAQRFCLTHFVAEAHGCGNRAKDKARAQISRDGVLYRGSGVPDRKPSASKRAHLERKLEGKLSDMNDKRKPKKKDK